jgi:hypothetical protein
VLYVGSNQLNDAHRYVLAWVGAGVEGPGGEWELTGNPDGTHRLRNRGATIAMDGRALEPFRRRLAYFVYRNTIEIYYKQTLKDSTTHG